MFESLAERFQDRTLVVWSAGKQRLALLTGALLERASRQQGLPYTMERLIHEFASLQAVDVTWMDGQRQRMLAEVQAQQNEILVALDWPHPECYAVNAP